MTNYFDGYGRRDPVPKCEDVGRIECPCCEGSGEHTYGAGMDAAEVPCRVCGGYGWLVTSAPTKREAMVHGFAVAIERGWSIG